MTVNQLEDISTHIASVDDSQLLKLKVLLDNEMSNRGLSFLVGDMGEDLAINYFNSTPGLVKLIKSPRGSKNVDALSRSGERFSIKTVQRGKKTGTIYPDLENPNKQLFEKLLIVKLDMSFAIESIHMFSWDGFLQAKAWDKRMNAWYVPYSLKKLILAEQVFKA